MIWAIVFIILLFIGAMCDASEKKSSIEKSIEDDVILAEKRRQARLEKYRKLLDEIEEIKEIENLKAPEAIIAKNDISEIKIRLRNIDKEMAKKLSEK